MVVRISGIVWLAAAMLALATTVGAQTNSSIAGVATDATGAVLPGVTVEVTSPALIEKVRSTITDGSGQYKIIELRPGSYQVTFSLPGFATTRREGIELTTGFTATVNGQLRVGDLSETLTVSGQSPIVDTQNVVQQHVMTRDVIDAIPTAKNFANLGTLIPGTTLYGYGRALDVGGSFGHANQMLMIHGSRSTDQQPLIDGMFVGFIGAGFMTFAVPDSNIQEINIETVAHSAETETGGVRVNMIPKAGGNRFTGSEFVSYTNQSLQSDNLDDRLVARGLSAVTRVNYLFDANVSIGGPIVRDRLWFYTGARDWLTKGFGTAFFDANPNDFVYTPDRTRDPAPLDKDSRNTTTRLTWQASPKDKVSVNLIYDYLCHCTQAFSGTFEALTMPEADQTASYFNRNAQVTWVRPASSRVLFEGGFSYVFNTLDERPVSTAVAPPALELSNGLSFRARSGAAGLNELFPIIGSKVFVGRASMSYVTGTHAFKFGAVINPGTYKLHRRAVGDYLAVLLNGIPNQVQFYTTPYDNLARWGKVALFAQDQWVMKRLTINAGLRFDSHMSSYDAVALPATTYLPARTFEGADVLNWKDLSPRLGASYDVFGNGRTAVKVSLGRYLASEAYGAANSVSPAVTSTARLARSWVDGNRDFVPQGDPRNPLLNGELGPSTNVNWGQPVNTLRYDPDWTSGWGNRGENWELNVGIQHELFPRVSVNASYDRRSYGNFTVIDNLAVAPSDYSTFCITAPRDERLPNGGGQQICGLYDIAPSRLGLLDRYQTLASNYGEQYEYWQGVDFSLNARLPRGLIFQGGLDTGQRVTDNCDVVGKVDNPSPLYCHTAQPFWAPSIKFLTSYPLPAQFEVAATFQSIPGLGDSTNPSVAANFVATNAQIAPSLGRNLAVGANGTVTVNLISPGSMLSDRVNQLDLRLSRRFAIGRMRLRGSFDVYNALNANPVSAWNQTYGTTGAAWLTPTSILPGRLAKFSAQLDF